MSTEDAVLFQRGDEVRVKENFPNHHHRTPWFVKGKNGRITDLCGAFPNPETRAYGGTGLPMQPLYRVEFKQSDLWEGESVNSSDKLLMDIYQNWLEPA